MHIDIHLGAAIAGVGHPPRGDLLAVLSGGRTLDDTKAVVLGLQGIVHLQDVPHIHRIALGVPGHDVEPELAVGVFSSGKALGGGEQGDAGGVDHGAGQALGLQVPHGALGPGAVDILIGEALAAHQQLVQGSILHLPAGEDLGAVGGGDAALLQQGQGSAHIGLDGDLAVGGCILGARIGLALEVIDHGSPLGGLDLHPVVVEQLVVVDLYLNIGHAGGGGQNLRPILRQADLLVGIAGTRQALIRAIHIQQGQLGPGGQVGQGHRLGDGAGELVDHRDIGLHIVEVDDVLMSGGGGKGHGLAVHQAVAVHRGAESGQIHRHTGLAKAGDRGGHTGGGALLIEVDGVGDAVLSPQSQGLGGHRVRIKVPGHTCYDLAVHRVPALDGVAHRELGIGGGGELLADIGLHGGDHRSVPGLEDDGGGDGAGIHHGNGDGGGGAVSQSHLQGGVARLSRLKQLGHPADIIRAGHAARGAGDRPVAVARLLRAVARQSKIVVGGLIGHIVMLPIGHRDEIRFLLSDAAGVDRVGSDLGAARLRRRAILGDKVGNGGVQSTQGGVRLRLGHLGACGHIVHQLLGGDHGGIQFVHHRLGDPRLVAGHVRTVRAGAHARLLGLGAGDGSDQSSGVRHAAHGALAVYKVVVHLLQGLGVGVTAVPLAGVGLYALLLTGGRFGDHPRVPLMAQGIDAHRGQGSGGGPGRVGEQLPAVVALPVLHIAQLFTAGVLGRNLADIEVGTGAGVNDHKVDGDVTRLVSRAYFACNGNRAASLGRAERAALTIAVAERHRGRIARVPRRNAVTLQRGIAV